MRIFIAKHLMIPYISIVRFWEKLDFRWFPIFLPDSEAKYSRHKDKRFYVYPEYKIFIKIFSASAREEFDAQGRALVRLSAMQGKGIPALYACGQIEESDELCLVMSYEGEPLDAWNDEDRREVERLVRLLHKNNVHHHDVGLRNVVVDNKRKFTLVDFTLSQVGCKDRHCTEKEDLGIGKKEKEQ